MGRRQAMFADDGDAVVVSGMDTASIAEPAAANGIIPQHLTSHAVEYHADTR
ncbi:hypothetical protein [Amycolatopsis sulphurea]|uniref:hypothetical protein n=1 Tax=Amycolatopsis sulphurea TaxID=76022 RepID=UPI001472BF7C|nr:hypothetical protein [Amycolatopsis sulphurea]